MEILMWKAAVDEFSEAIMAWFKTGNIQDRLEMQEYEDIYELLHKAILIEQQLKRKSYSKENFRNSTRPSYAKDNKVFVKPKEETKA